MKNENPYSPTEFAGASDAGGLARSAFELFLDRATLTLLIVYGSLTALDIGYLLLVSYTGNGDSYITSALTLGGVISLLLLAVVFIVWSFVSHRNLKKKFGFDRLSVWSGVAFFGYFVPLLNLVLPQELISDLYIGYKIRSTGSSAQIMGKNRVRVSGAWIVLLWWLSFLLFVGAVLLFYLTVSDAGGSAGMYALFVLREAARLVSLALAAYIVMEINRMKREAYRHRLAA
ncbi:MAG: DUF4328 domain-containing protein [bacterium]|nr:DUF4328 domain-containing protein [bacterium]